MKVSLITVGTKMPGWVQEAIKEYQKRIQSELNFSLIEIPLPKRNKSQNIQ